ncbi:PREDICTED: zinc finger BED domain-containing protein 5-like [Habropoda laboriosa]|uniref:zinc finger BED domain-containing protein 5-like n=1 Tax=Habropoda laboriosa TaxID=597456 RepID=UPI00083E0AAB|nr:PREDICTED: zinc finger BED domain-containing protein 5-like [Habropoda laboriosa]
MSNYCELELIKRLKNSQHGFTLQLDESTDVAGLAILLVFVRYIHGIAAQEDMLICKALLCKTTGEEIFKLIDSYFEKYDISWDLCQQVCADGAKAMLGNVKGAVARIKQKNPHIRSTHCCLHRQALAVKKMPEELKVVLNDCVKIVNFIKSRPLNARIFTLLCENMGSLHKTLLLHTEVRWLSRGKVMTRFCELKDEIRMFLTEHASELAYQLNEADRYFCNILVMNNAKLNENVKYNYLLQHLSDLQETFLEYFPSQTEKSSWIQNPFEESCDTSQLPIKEKEQHINISTDSLLRITFFQVDIMHFWLQIMNENPEIAKRAVKYLMSFVSTTVRMTCQPIKSVALFGLRITELTNFCSAGDCTVSSFSHYQSVLCRSESYY